MSNTKHHNVFTAISATAINLANDRREAMKSGKRLYGVVEGECESEGDFAVRAQHANISVARQAKPPPLLLASPALVRRK